MARPTSWRDVPRSNPARGSRYTPGGLAAWRSIVPENRSRRRSGGRGSSGLSEAEQRALQVASDSFEKDDDGFNLFNAGGRALLGALDVFDTPRAAVTATLNEIADAGQYGGEFNWRDVVQNTRDNITMGEAMGLDSEEGSIAKSLIGFGADVVVDPLSYVGGVAARVGVEAGKPAARALLRPSVKNFLGEQAAAAAERAGTKFTDDAARAAFVAEQGEKLSAQAAQKALKYRSNQALDPLAREAIGADPGTYIKIPGRRLKLDKLIEGIAPGRVYESTIGTPALRLTKRELGLGRVAGHARSMVSESALGNRTARLFTKFPDLRDKVLFGSPTDAMKAFQAMEEQSASQLQRRLKETVWGTRMTDLLTRAKRAGIDGEDLRYAIAEAVEEGEEQFAGDSSARVLAKAVAKDDPDLLDEFRQFFRDIRDDSNALDPELPWLQYRKNYTTRTPSDEMIALRGGWSGSGGALRRETFDFRRKYGIEADQVDELMGRKLVDPAADAKGRSIDRQIDDILDEEGAPNWFERDAYKAFPDYVKRTSKRYGDEWLAKQLRDLGIAEPSWTQQLTARGKTQGRAKAAIQALQTRASVRAEKARMEAERARSVSIASEGNLAAREGALEAGVKRAEHKRLRQSILDADAVREYSDELRLRADVLQTRRQGLLDSLADAESDVSGLRGAQRELGRRITAETQDAYSRVTDLELYSMELEEELGRIYDSLALLQTGVTPEAISARQVLNEMEGNAGQIAELSDKMRRAESLLSQFEDLAARDLGPIDAQLQQTDQMLQQAVAEYTENPAFADKVMVLADIKASLIHEKAVIERAQGRIADLDRSNPAGWLDEMDDLSNAQAMGDRFIHTLFPDLPPEIQGLRIREFFADRQPELLQMIDDTNGQILSAFTDRDSMLVELAQIRQDKRVAEQKLASVRKGVTAEDRVLEEEQLALFQRADEAAQRAMDIDDEIATLGSQLELADQVNLTAERFVAALKAKHAHYEGIAAAAEHKASNARRVQQTWDRIAKDNLSKEQETALTNALHAGYKELGAVSMTQDHWLVDGLRAATIMAPPAGLRPALRAYDKVHSLWKGYALSTPGTVLRNLFGGVFNNYLAGGVQPEDYARVMAWRFGSGRMSDADKAIFQQLEDAGLFVGAASSTEIENHMVRANLNPLSTDNAYVRFFRGRQEDAEAVVRGALAYRTLKNGGTMNDAIGRVIKYHFDYDDLSAVERSVFRRIVPFYTWTRKNFPLMLEQIVQNPQKFTRFYQLKNEIEQQSPEQKFVPSYFAENLAVRLPFDLGSGQAYALPDLPFTALNDVTDPSLAFSQVTPFLKTPLEYAFGKQFFKGLPLEDEYQPVPKLMDAIPGLMPALDAMGMANQGPDGWMMKHKDMYVLEQMMPSFGKARRLFPSEERYTERALTSWLSFAFGLGLRTNTPTDQRNEAYRRIYSELERYQSRRELGYVDFGFTDEGNVRQPPAAYNVYEAQFGGD